MGTWQVSLKMTKFAKNDHCFDVKNWETIWTGCMVHLCHYLTLATHYPHTSSVANTNQDFSARLAIIMGYWWNNVQK